MSDQVYIGTHDEDDDYLDLNAVALELLCAHVSREGQVYVSEIDIDRAIKVATEFVMSARERPED